MKRINLWVNVLMIFYVSSIKSYQINLSFDSLFPKTWYQKGLEASMHVWQSLMTVFENNSDGAMLSLDLLLGRLAFAQFCINRMHQEGVICVADDRAYFSVVLDKVKRLLALVTITPQTDDFVLCAEDMITEMERKLQKN
ncbi:MAG TPA: hypothetical protein VHX42_03670 [Candidatus Babeliales bacterium]|jgi:hypothetical protein|nr:hypothetical protein [Candidatus Babeliales bacterium]